MKFAHSLVLNAVPDWIDQYVDYDHLKKLVYRIERINFQELIAREPRPARILEEASFEKSAYSLARTASEEARDEDDKRFIQECDIQLKKVCDFFAAKETEILEDARTLRSQFDTFGVPLHDETRQDFRCDASEHTPEKSDAILAGQQYDEQGVLAEAHDSDPASEGLPVLRRSRSVSGQGEAEHKQLQQHFTPPTVRSRIMPLTEPPSGSRANVISNEFLARSPILMPAVFLSMQRTSSLSSAASPAGLEEFDRLHNFRARCAFVYILLAELESYVSLNRSAFDKITKKWDKITGSQLRRTYYEEVVLSAYPFQPERLCELDQAMQLIQRMYAVIYTSGDMAAAFNELKTQLRDHIQFERNTVWQDMVGRERRTLDAHAMDEKPGFRIPKLGIFCSRATLRSIITFLVSLAVFLIFLCIDTLGQPEASRCLALLLFAAMLWAFESLPLFATAYLIPLLIVTMQVLTDDNGNPMDAVAASKAVFSSMFNGTIMVLLGGFAIAAALNKHGITKAFAAVVLSRAGNKPHWVILANMYVAVFLCMWISNVATPVLCFSLIQPILRTLPPNSTVGPCLILGIALASCIGGLASPISSPQNIITIQLMEPNPGWDIWFAASLPLGIICILTTWAILLVYFRPARSTPRINVIKSQPHGRPSYSQIWVTLVCLATIALWCSETALESFWGGDGTIAIIPFVLLFGTNMLNKLDLNNFLWSVLTLAQGGMALGYAVEKSGLLDIIGRRIADGVQDLPVIAISFIFGVLVLVFATFVSHTVAALIILPIVKQVGQQLSPPHPNLLVMVTGLTSSVAMGLPVSGFPNMNAIMQEDPTGRAYLHMKDFVFCGIPSSIVAGIIVILLGLSILSRVGF